ncbi:hypothetical protein KDA23_03595 [Candidatus Saccharibacteria bacterium]|nr:hypothetical protein [Candidatus Saccharibacteria bacterium]
MKQIKKSLLVGASVATVGLSSFGMAAAATSTNSNSDDSLVSKIAAKFNLNKSDVQAVFDADRQEHMTEMKTKRAEALKQAVTDGKLTQAQADHITAAWKEIDSLMGDTRPDQQSSATRKSIKAKMDALRTWTKNQGIDLESIEGLGGPHGGPGGRGHGPMDDDDSSSSSSN